jgi:hypothetical protein
MAVENDAGFQVLGAINRIDEVGGADGTVSGNSTITTLAAAIIALPPVVGAGPDANRQIARGLRMGVNAGFIPETHGVTTIAGLAALVSNAMNPPLSSSYSGGGLPG